MNVRLLQRVTAGLCLAMALGLVLLQFVFTPERSAPTFLFIPFTGLWVFGAVMVFVAPRFGAVGTTLWGLVSAWGVLSTHNRAVEDTLLIVGSLAAAAVAATLAWRLVARAR